MPRYLLALLALAALPRAAAAQDGLLEELRRGSPAQRDAAQARLKAAGLTALRPLVGRAGDADFEKRRDALLRPYRARLFWDEVEKRGLSRHILGTLEGRALILTREVGSARQRVARRKEGGFLIETEGRGSYEKDSGEVTMRALFDEAFHMVEARVVYTENSANGASASEQTWRRLDARSTPETAVYQVAIKGEDRPRELSLPRGAVFPDVLAALGRGMDRDSRRSQRLELELINPGDFKVSEAVIKSVRREKVVVRGGDRAPALRLQASSDALPDALPAAPLLWLGADQRPLKARSGPLTAYFVSEFRPAAAPVSAPRSGEGAPPKADPEGKKRYF